MTENNKKNKKKNLCLILTILALLLVVISQTTHAGLGDLNKDFFYYPGMKPNVTIVVGEEAAASDAIAAANLAATIANLAYGHISILTSSWYCTLPNGTKIFVGGPQCESDDPVEIPGNLVVSDASSPGNNLIIIGGSRANSMGLTWLEASDVKVEVSGNKLYVAGYTGAQTNVAVRMVNEWLKAEIHEKSDRKPVCGDGKCEKLIVVSDTSPLSGNLVIIGGSKANKVGISGLESGDSKIELEGNRLYIAGYTARDTHLAVQQVIAWLKKGFPDIENYSNIGNISKNFFTMRT